MNTTDGTVTEYLNKIDTKQLSYSEAREALLKLGYSDDDITLAVSNHEPIKPVALSNFPQPDAATVAIAKAKLGFVTDNALREDQVTSMATAILFPNRHAKGYFFSKFLKNYADAKDLAEHGKLGPTEGGNLYQRYRFVRYSTWIAAILLVPMVVIALPGLSQFTTLLYYQLKPGQMNILTIPLYLIAIIGWVSALFWPLVLFLTKKESTLRAYVIGACIVPGILGIGLGLFIQNYFIVGASLLGMLFSLWQASRVGILSVLARK